MLTLLIGAGEGGAVLCGAGVLPADPAAPSGEGQVLGPGVSVDVGQSQVPGRMRRASLKDPGPPGLVHPTRGTSELGPHFRLGSCGSGCKGSSPGLCTRILNQPPGP